MRLLYWTETFWPLIGGVQNYAKQFIPAIRERGFEVTVVTVRFQDHPETETVDGTTVIRLPVHEVLQSRDPAAFLSLRRKLDRLHGEIRPQVIHANFYGPSVALLVDINKRRPVPTVVACHQDLSDTTGFGSTVAQLMDQASWVTAVSRSALQNVRELFPQVRDKSSFIYNGLSVGAFRPTPIPEGPPRVVCVGRLVEIKGFEIALEAFAAIAADFPEARLVVAGDGPEKPALSRRAAELGISDAVEFPGWVESAGVREMIAGSTAVIVPSRFPETFGLVAAEAALMARPVVATRLGGLEEVVEDGETGALVRNGDAAAFAEALRRLFSDRALASRQGERARELAVERFSLDRNVTAYAELYRSLVADNGAPP